MNAIDAPLQELRLSLDSCEAQAVAAQGMRKHLRRELLKHAQDEAARAAAAADKLVKAFDREIWK